MYLSFKINILVVMDCYCFDRIFLRGMHKKSIWIFCAIYSVKIFTFHANIPKLSEPVHSS